MCLCVCRLDLEYGVHDFAGLVVEVAVDDVCTQCGLPEIERILALVHHDGGDDRLVATGLPRGDRGGHDREVNGKERRTVGGWDGEAEEDGVVEEKEWWAVESVGRGGDDG